MARMNPEDLGRLYEQAQQLRQKNENDWKLAAAHCLPRQYSLWSSIDSAAKQGSASLAAARSVAIDTTAARALPKYMAILERMCTPHNMRWQILEPTDRVLARNRRVSLYFEELTTRLFTQRYQPRSGFRRMSNEVYSSMGVYGNGPAYYGARRITVMNKNPSVLYRGLAMRNIFVLVNDEGEVDTVFNRFWLNYRQFKQKFGDDAAMPKCMMPYAGARPDENKYYEFVHVVMPRNDYDPSALNVRRHPFVGSYLSVQDKQYVGDEQGFISMPYLFPRTMTEAEDPYGISPAVQALGAMGSASAIKKTTLKQGQKAADPTLLAYDDGAANGTVDMRPGAIYYGGVNKDGRQLVHALPTGNFQIAAELLQDERTDINDSFFVTLFQILTETPEMTATEVMERVAEKASLLAPTMGQLQSEFLGPGTMREIDLLSELGLLNDLPMPPELIEAKGQYDITYTSPMAKGMYAEEVSGFMRALETALTIVNATQDPSHLDHFNFDAALPEMSAAMAVPARWMNDDKTRDALREARSAQQQQAQLLQAAAPLASAAKTAASMENGGGAK